MISFIGLKEQYKEIKEEIDNAIKVVIQKQQFFGGPYVEVFELNFAEYIAGGQSQPYCVAVGNGTDALQFAIRALQLEKGSEIIVPANTFTATAEAVSLAGMKVIFADVCGDTALINLIDAEKRLTRKTKAIIPVHLFGNVVDISRVNYFAKRNRLKVVEDASHAAGGFYKDGDCVGMSDNTIAFSFNPTKNLGAYGDAGAVVTPSKKIAQFIGKFRNHGRVEKHVHKIRGTNSRMDNIQAAVLIVKLRHLDRWQKTRRAVAKMYTNNLHKDYLFLGREIQTDAFHLFVICCKNKHDRFGLMEYMEEEKIPCGIHYPTALPFSKAYNKKGDFSVAKYLSDRIISIPIHGNMSVTDVAHVVETLNYYREVLCKHD